MDATAGPRRDRRTAPDTSRARLMLLRGLVVALPLVAAAAVVLSWPQRVPSAIVSLATGVFAPGVFALNTVDPSGPDCRLVGGWHVLGVPGWWAPAIVASSAAFWTLCVAALAFAVSGRRS